MANTTKHITLRVSEELLRLIDQHAASEKRSRSNMVERMLWSAVMEGEDDPTPAEVQRLDAAFATTACKSCGALNGQHQKGCKR